MTDHFFDQKPRMQMLNLSFRRKEHSQSLRLLIFCLLGSLLIAANVTSSLAAEVTPKFVWAKVATGFNPDQGQDLAVDAAGNVFVTGYFSSAISFGSTTLTNAGLFLAKYDKSGNFLWAKRDGINLTQGYGIGLDANGNIYVGGSFMPYNNNPIVIGGVTMVSRGLSDVFVAKYDSEGNPIWVRQFGGTGTDYMSGFAVDSVGHCHLITYSWSGSMFSDNRILKLDGEGNEIWAIPTPIVGYPLFRDLGIDNAGNAYVSGAFKDIVTFGETNFTSAGEADVLVVKYDPDGQLVWARQGGGATNETSDRIAVSPAGDCYVSGSFRSTTTFDTFTLSNTSTYSCRFVAKYDSQGSVIWAKQYFGDRDVSRSVAAGDSAGNGFVTTETGTTNILSAKFDPQGATLWFKTIEYSNLGYPPAIPRVRADGAGNYYLVGDFHAPNLILDEHTLTNTSSADFFVAKLETTTPPPLLIERLADSARLSWSVLAENFHLESTGALSDSTAWTSNALTLEVLGLSNVVSLPITSEPMFFRLNRP